MSFLYSAVYPDDSGLVVTARNALTSILPHASINSDLQSILFHRALSFTEIDVLMDREDATTSRARLSALTRRCLDYVKVSSFLHHLTEILRISLTLQAWEIARDDLQHIHSDGYIFCALCERLSGPGTVKTLSDSTKTKAGGRRGRNKDKIIGKLVARRSLMSAARYFSSQEYYKDPRPEHRHVGYGSGRSAIPLYRAGK